MNDWAMCCLKARFGGLLLFFLACLAGAASAQDAARGRTLYVEHCARCHADPPGSGSINPLVRTADEIRGALGRVSPMRMLNALLSDADLRDIAAYFVTVLGEPTNNPDFNVGDVWWDSSQNGWALLLRQHSGRKQLAGIWYTFDADGKAAWYLFNGGSWSAPSVYTAKLYRHTGSPLTVPYDAAALRATEVGTAALVFSNRDVADATFVVDGVRVIKKIGRFSFPP